MKPSGSEPLCQVIDTDRPPGRPRERVPVWSLAELEELLQGYAALEPRILEVHLPRSVFLFVGIGGDLAAVTGYPIPNPPPGMWPGWTAQARCSYTTEPREFVYECVPHPFEAEALMPTEEVIGIVLDFVRTGDLPRSHTWGPPGSDPYRWGEGGTRAVWEEFRRRRESEGDIPF